MRSVLLMKNQQAVGKVWSHGGQLHLMLFEPFTGVAHSYQQVAARALVHPNGYHATLSNPMPKPHHDDQALLEAFHARRW